MIKREGLAPWVWKLNELLKGWGVPWIARRWIYYKIPKKYRKGWKPEDFKDS